jgi:hypothetical protein
MRTRLKQCCLALGGRYPAFNRLPRLTFSTASQPRSRNVLTVTIETAKGVHKFDCDATSEEFQGLWDRMEEMAEDEGHDPRQVANAAIHMTATKGPSKDATQRRGQLNWIVYAVLCYVADNVDLANMVGQAGVLSGPPTIFDLAAHQNVKAKIKVEGNEIKRELAGSAQLDS